MKILQISPCADPKLGGQERHMVTLSKILGSFGHEVTILTCQTGSSNISQNIQVSTINSINLMGLRLIHPRELITFLLEKRFDVCHLHHQTLLGETILFINKTYGLPTITTLHTQILRRVPAKLFYDRASLKLIGKLSDRVICLSPGIMQSLVRRGLTSSKCVVIPNAIDVKSLESQFQKIRGELHEPEFDLLFIGRLEQRKGIRWLLQSLTLLHKKGKKVTLKIVGQGQLKDECRRIISANNLGQHVNLLGYVPNEELLKLFLLTRCVVIPSLYEGVPGVALEAMAAGKPLIVSNIPGLGELVIDEGNGLIVNTLDIQGLASAIDKVLASPSCVSSLDDINKEVLRRFDWNVVAKSIMEIYQESSH